jgi:hypothetical protein
MIEVCKEVRRFASRPHGVRYVQEENVGGAYALSVDLV